MSVIDKFLFQLRMRVISLCDSDGSSSFVVLFLNFEVKVSKFAHVHLFMATN